MIPFPFQAGQLGNSVTQRGGTYFNDFSQSNTTADFTAYQSVSGTTWAISGGALAASGGSSNQAFFLCNAQTFTDGYVESNMTRADQAGVVLRGSSASSAYFLAVRDGSSLGAINTVELYKVVAGVFTSISGTQAVAWVRGSQKKFGLRISGSSIDVVVDGATVYSTTDTAIPGSGRAGLYCFGALVNSFNDFLIQA